MNKQNFTKWDRFPITTESLEFIQEMIYLVGNLAALGGDNYVLSGCYKIDALTVGSGVIVVNGEILLFQKSAVNPYLLIEEMYVDEVVNGIPYPQARVIRSARLTADDTGVLFSEIPRIQTNIQQQMHHGMIMMWSGSIAEIPAGWALCDGNNDTPDLRGRFIVGYDVDNKDYDAIGNTGGYNAITLNAEQMPVHTHTAPAAVENGPTRNEGFNTGVTGGAAFMIDPNRTLTTDAAGGLAGDNNISTTQAHENRPPYYTLAYIMKL